MSRTRLARHILVGGAILIAAGATLCVVSQRATRGQRVRHTPAPQTDPTATLWKDLAADLPPALADSRSVLLGDRTLNGRTCVVMGRTGTEAVLRTRAKGGPGMHMAWLSSLGAACRKPSESLAWHQGRLRQEIGQIRGANQEVLPTVVKLAAMAEALSDALTEAEVWPSALEPLGLDGGRSWPAYCLASLDAAAVRQDLPAARRAARELASALFGLADLHRWLELMTRTHLKALDFQARAAEVFYASDAAYRSRYQPIPDLTAFPGGSLCELGNYYEIERQAEWLFRIPDAFLGVGVAGVEEVRQTNGPHAAGAVWMPPHLRPAFLRLRAALGPRNQPIWDAAAHTPYERSYLVGVLHRTDLGGHVEDLAKVLDRFSRRRPSAAMHELMDVIYHRGGNTRAAVAWGDRFHPKVVAEAAEMKGPDRELFLESHAATTRLFVGWEGFDMVDTAAEAADTGRMDCVIASALVGHLYRNAGGTGGLLLRASAGLAGHTLAAAEVGDGAERRVLVMDSLDKTQRDPLVWPAGFRQGCFWPEGYPDPTPPFFTFELYGRGLDNYVWLEGMIVRGSSAGVAMKANVPYLPGRGGRAD